MQTEKQKSKAISLIPDHPLIRLTSFLSLTLGMTQNHSNLALILGTIITLTIHCHHGWHETKRLLSLLWKLKGIWITLILSYIFFAPGEGGERVLFGLKEGGQHLGSMILLTSVAIWLVQATPLPKLQQALACLLYPLDFIGLPGQLFAARLIQVLHRVPLWTEHFAKTQIEWQPLSWCKVQKILATLWSYALNDTLPPSLTGQEDTLVVVAQLALPLWWEWFYPLSIVLLFILASIF